MKCLQVTPVDNVATAIEPLAAGANALGVLIKEEIKSGHKFALKDLKKGEFIIKYGEVIGAASCDIAAGSWVHVHNVCGVRGRGDESDSSAFEAAVASSKASTNHKDFSSDSAGLKNRKLSGFRRANGSFGLRNHVLIIPSVVCANKVVQRIAAACPGAVHVIHQHGCSQLDFDAEQTRDVLAGSVANPNVFGALVVGLGCETISSESIKELALKIGYEKPIECINIQQMGGISACAAEGVKIVERLLAEAAKCERSEGDISDICLGTECGGSDSYSGLSANPALGALSDSVIDLGGQVILAETTELIGAEAILARRAANEQVAEKIYEKIYGFEQNVKDSGADIRGANPSPGNIAGGLTTIEEKSLGCVYKAGSRTIEDVIDYAKPVRKKGLTFMDTPGNDIEQLSAMVAGGANVVVFTTGRGTPTGSAITPVIKMSTNDFCAQNMSESIDINAGGIISGQKSINQVRDELLDLIEQVSKGGLVKAEINEQNDFSVWRIATTC